MPGMQNRTDPFAASRPVIFLKGYFSIFLQLIGIGIMNKPVIIFGAKGIAVPALEIFNSNKVMVYGFLDEDKELFGREINTVAVLGHTENDDFLKLLGKKCEAFVAVDDNAYRKYLVKLLNEQRKIQPINAIHSTAFIASSAAMGHGNFINAEVVIGAGAKLGHHGIFNTGSCVEYQTEIGDFVQLGAGSVINANVKIEDEVFIGSGVTVISGINIGKKARVGAGSVVVADVPAGATVFGNPAAPIKK